MYVCMFGFSLQNWQYSPIPSSGSGLPCPIVAAFGQSRFKPFNSFSLFNVCIFLILILILILVVVVIFKRQWHIACGGVNVKYFPLFNGHVALCLVFSFRKTLLGKTSIEIVLIFGKVVSQNVLTSCV